MTMLGAIIRGWTDPSRADIWDAWTLAVNDDREDVALCLIGAAAARDWAESAKGTGRWRRRLKRMQRWIRLASVTEARCAVGPHTVTLEQFGEMLRAMYGEENLMENLLYSNRRFIDMFTGGKK